MKSSPAASATAIDIFILFITQYYGSATPVCLGNLRGRRA